MKLRQLVRKAGGHVAELVMPRVCAACGMALGSQREEMCQECWGEVSRCVGGSYCSSCGEDRSSYLLSGGECTKCRLRKSRLRLDGFARVGCYDGALKQLILGFKHRFVLDKLLGQLLSHAILGRFDPDEVDLWVPVPAHWRRRLTVGFQPSALLARATVAGWGGRVECVLAAKRFVPPFHLREKMSASARATAIKGAFEVVSGHRVRGRTVCVVDDVTTTGATLGEARRALQTAGAGRIMAAVLAKTCNHPVESTGLDRVDEGL